MESSGVGRECGEKITLKTLFGAVINPRSTSPEGLTDITTLTLRSISGTYVLPI